jgi:GH15 family glucan-1,4-alpha-glucosidase
MSEAEALVPAIGDYGLIGDCHGCALVSSEGSIDWMCVPRFDSGSVFARILDGEQGGFCAVRIEDARAIGSSYLPDTLVHESDFEVDGGAGLVRVLDFFAVRRHGAERPLLELIRIVECVRGSARAVIEVAPCFDYGAVRPWLRRVAADAFTAIGGSSGLFAWSDRRLELEGESVCASASLEAGERLRLMLRWISPHLLERERPTSPSAEEVDARLEETVAWWRHWRKRVRADGPDGEAAVRSALTLKALIYAPTGAITAAASASLPEDIGGERNWDYRFSWIRDSALAARAFAELGCEQEAMRSRHFIVRSSAGHADDVQVLFGIGGERRLAEQELDLAGYRNSRPVRIGNCAAKQVQLDAFGEIINLGWRWHLRGHPPDDDEWRFFYELVETSIERWREPDRGIWEWRGEPRHFVHSKAACWAAVDRGLRLAEECMRRAPTRRWRNARQEIREAIESHGYDERRGVFVQCFEERRLDAALLLLPVLGFLDFEDERMVRTADAVREDLGEGGFLRRYRADDSLPGTEGAFLPCSFWLAECYARQGRLEEAREVFDHAVSAASPLGLFSEQVDPRSGELLGNYPQALTHLSHIAAAVALAGASERSRGSTSLA